MDIQLLLSIINWYLLNFPIEILLYLNILFDSPHFPILFDGIKIRWEYFSLSTFPLAIKWNVQMRNQPNFIN